MADICKFCGSRLGHSPQGEYCTNERCSYVDGTYNGPRNPMPSDPLEGLSKLLATWRSRPTPDEHGQEYANGHGDAELHCADELAALLPALRERIAKLEKEARDGK